MRTNGRFVFSICAPLLLPGLSPGPAWSQAGEPITLTVRTDQPGARINPAMWGIFFEDINFGADGGLYAELVKNRSFDFPEALMGWQTYTKRGGAGSARVEQEKPVSPQNPNYLRLNSGGSWGFGVVNEGFRGIGLKRGEKYALSFYARNPSTRNPVLRVDLLGPGDRVLATTKFKKFDPNWGKCSAVLEATATEAKARLAVSLEGPGTLDLDFISLFPEKTWKNRPGGLRADMVQLLADLKPGFLRFPGGCIVEGRYLTNRYQWKTTIGMPEERKLIINRWNDEFKHRPTPDYYQSFGLGFFEYFQLCEDIGAEPLPILNCGMACQFNSSELAPLDQLDPYIQDALDLIEFANGPATSVWGARRAAMGHPAPFKLKMIGVGNEQWGPQYFERYARFARALKEHHPEIQLVSSAGPAPADDRFHFAWGKLRDLDAEIVDEHCYAAPQWFLDNARRYDNYDRRGPKVFMGEFAAQSVAIASPKNRNNLECALAEAAYMTGMERNADVVRLSSYAPLFGHSDAWQWTPNLIWCDNLRIYGTPNYYAQQLFSRNRGDVVLPVALRDAAQAVAAGGIGLSTYKTAAEFKEVRVTRAGTTLLSSVLSDKAEGWRAESAGKWSIQESAYRQSDPGAIAATFAGDKSWSDYSLALKARKLDGAEGFIIIVRNSGPGSQVQWNLGGWSNKQHGLQVLSGGQERILKQVPGTIETGRWYDIRIELKGERVDCYLDNQLVQSADVSAASTPRLFASAVQDDATHEIIVKVVNPHSKPQACALELNGLPASFNRARVTVLAGTSGADENSFENPLKVAPRSQPREVSSRFQHTFPPLSATVFRIGAK